MPSLCYNSHGYYAPGPAYGDGDMVLPHLGSGIIERLQNFSERMFVYMSGHSKWNNIKKRKESTDGAKAKIFTKMAREIAVAVKEGGGDPETNSKLRDCIAKAKANNVPNDNIDRVIKKAVGSKDGSEYEEIVYEGYGPNGVAVIVESLTDNRNRTAGEVRHYFDKCGGNLGQTGCVSFMFERKGVIVIDEGSMDEEKLMEDCFEVGAADFDYQDGIAEIFTAQADLGTVRDALEQKGYSFASAEVAYVPSTYTKIDDPDQCVKMEKLLDLLEDNDDVQNVWHNWESDEDEE